MEKIMIRLSYSVIGLAFIGGWRLHSKLTKDTIRRAAARELYLTTKLDENGIEPTEFDKIAMNNL